MIVTAVEAVKICQLTQGSTKTTQKHTDWKMTYQLFKLVQKWPKMVPNGPRIGRVFLFFSGRARLRPTIGRVFLFFLTFKILK
jgi:hypothetical protein